MDVIPISSKIRNFTIIDILQPNGENANVYLVEDEYSNKFVIKHFCKSVKPYIPYGKENHFGRRREGAWEVFGEIKQKSESNDFIINFYDRFKWLGKWCIVIEYIDGITLNKFIINHLDDERKIFNVIKKFAKEVKTWHINEFALGDSHLENVIVESSSEFIKLIDYSQIHHPDFKYCKKFNCYTPKDRRIKEDIEKTTKHFGRGFLTELQNLEKRNQIDLQLSKVFLEEYNSI